MTNRNSLTAAVAFATICLLSACSADFQSGQTKCSAQKTCPEGFSCNNLGYCSTPTGAQSPAGGGTVNPGGTDAGTNPRGTGGATTTPTGTGGGTTTPTGTGGATTTPTGTGGAMTTPGGMAVFKFCNDLTRGMMDITIDISVDGTNIKASAKTGTCTSALNTACTAVPPGTRTFQVAEGTTKLSMLSTEIVAGGEYIFYVEIENMMPVLKGVMIAKAGVTCSNFDPFAMMPGAESFPGTHPRSLVGRHLDGEPTFVGRALQVTPGLGFAPAPSHRR